MSPNCAALPKQNKHTCHSLGSYLRAFCIKVVQCLFSELSPDGAVQTLNMRENTDAVKECQVCHIDQTRAPQLDKILKQPMSPQNYDDTEDVLPDQNNIRTQAVLMLKAAPIKK